MNKNMQCSNCGAPNESELRCNYCGNNFSEKTKLITSKIEKSSFDLAIYEFKKGNYEKSIIAFDKLILIDSNNRLAWFYKFSSELGGEQRFNNYLSETKKNEINWQNFSLNNFNFVAE